MADWENRLCDRPPPALFTSAELDDPVRRYLETAIGPGAPPAVCARWLPFSRARC
jgi:hypothetical protein